MASPAPLTTAPSSGAADALAAHRIREWQWRGLLLLAPALALIALLFMLPLGVSIVDAFEAPEGGFTLAHFQKAWEYYHTDFWATLRWTLLSTALIAAAAIVIAGYLTLGENPLAQAALRWLYRWPLFIPFIVTAQVMRGFLAKNGLMNHALIGTGAIEPLQAQSFVDWPWPGTGIVIAFVWKQTPFVALMLAGAMASLDRSTIEAARNLGARRVRTLFEIVLPQVMPSLFVGLILSFVTMLSVLSVPIMLSGDSPTMLTVDIAYRINSHRDYSVANALGTISCVMAGVVAWFYLRQGVAQRS
jgi:ABC-type spermidine/putrescine transport system permease subunit I